ncbi:branched-chain amino acid ABC transporter permease [Leifsonia naganoensis]|uniref:Branched-chain amino acid transport system permease protein n=1 Tax=Leifsonia naganoensis TaxID=150025 RepID=A0A853DQW9_9MICO|nr:branched-chain amino acid ABC transporter permease [Leifsonia naganoensis]NYK08500.1 branched-chain amino acid transport system permease protein [Leifsonia naganoensis]
MLQGALAGLAAGGLYAVLAVCLTLMARLVRVVNFSQAATGMFGGFVAVWLVSHAGWPIWLGSLVGVLIGGALSALIGLIIATWLPEADITTRSAVTVGPLLMLISLSFILFGNKPQPFSPILSGPAFSIGGVVVSQVTVVTVALAIVVAVACRIVLVRTSIGTKLRALSERPTTAELIGIPSRPLSVAVWAVTGLISALVIIIVAPSQSNDATSLSMLIVPASAAALLGGFRRLDLAVVGGLVLGLLSGLVAQIDAVSFIRNFLPFLFIVGFLLWMQRKEVWDAAR